MALCVSRCGDDGPPLKLAPPVNLDRMMGGWYIVANIPNWLENGLVALHDEYSRRPDGDIQQDFVTHEGNFESPKKHYNVHDWLAPGTNDAGWRVVELPEQTGKPGLGGAAESTRQRNIGGDALMF